MAILIVLAFIAVPIAEIAIFIEVGGRIGLLSTLTVVALTAIIGTWMLRAQGLSTLHRAQVSLARNEFPASEVFDGICLLVGGAFLLTPGFLTDALGFLLFLPPARAILRALVWRHLSRSGTVWVNNEIVIDRGRDAGGGADGRTIEGDFHEIPPDANGKRGRKP